MDYKFNEIEKKWQDKWKADKVYKVSNESAKPKYYVLDMFPYPSGAGLHVGHPLGYIASDIYSRYKRLKGFNVLHPMGFDSFGLPAEQYAIETGQHPAETTKKNIETFKKQLDKIGFCYDWEREVQTSDPNYYKWTQKIFLELFNSWYNIQKQKAEPITELVKVFENEGSSTVICQPSSVNFSADQWKSFSPKEQQDILMNYRLAYSSYGEVNWCEALGTVLANDEVVNGVSERGGHPVVKKKMRQWYLRITAYADRLLQGLETVDFSESMKEMQRNWIGRSEGAEIVFPLSISPHRGEEKEEQNAKVNMPGFGYASYKVDSALSFENAKKMRKQPTEAEAKLWESLRASKMGYKFRRQHPIENYIADFICLDVWIIIEVDGGYHTSTEQKEADAIRDNALNEIGFKTLRFTNDEVLNNLNDVLSTIKAAADEIKSIAAPKIAEARGSSPLQGEAGVRVYTTRPDTIFGVDFMVVAPEHELIESITTEEQKQAVQEYITYVKSRSDRERQAEKSITGAFTGAFAINPFDGKQIPIWISEYVLAGYGTGAIMAVPCGDERDFKFAQHFNIPITNIIGAHYDGTAANPTKEAILENSGFLNGLLMKDAIGIAINKLEEMGIGKRKVNFKMRDAGFSRQRYWGEPFPIVWNENGTATALDVNQLPLELPHVEKYGPGPEGEGPLANITDWVELSPNEKRETNTMPGYAGSSWYFLRYMDPNNTEAFIDRKVSDYWNSVDLYIGGTEHAVGHLLYSRMWTKVLYDLGYIGFEEPFKKLLNQGMITGKSYFFQLSHPFSNMLVSYKKDDSLQAFIRFKYGHKYVDGLGRLFRKDFERYLVEQNSAAEDFDIIWDNEDGIEFIQLKEESEKMSKSKFNVDNPDELCEQYGADTFRMYEMFLGPVEQSKPWDTKGIEGVHRFLKKLWRLFYSDTTYKNNEAVKGKPIWNNDTPTAEELKVLHKTIKKIDEDTERFSYNTAVSAFMVCVNELADLKCTKKAILEQVLVLLTPYAPHIAEELWHVLGNETTILDAAYPVYNASFTTESSKEYPVSINGKMRTTLTFPVDVEQKDVEPVVLANEVVQKWLEGKDPKKIIFVKNKMINVVI
jgi:leucyl-tRNA synthetase